MMSKDPARFQLFKSEVEKRIGELFGMENSETLIE